MTPTRRNQLHLISGIIVGGFMTFMVISTWLSFDYGRMTNHLTCDKSVSNLAELNLHKECDHYGRD